MIGPRTLGFADYTGNKQFISTGNLAENDKAFLFLMDYAHRRRVKIWGRAQVVTDDATLIERLMPEGYRARAEQAIVFEVAAWDINCSQHIPQRSMPRMSPKRWLDWKVGSPNSKPRILPFGQEWKVIVHEPSA